VNIFRLHYSKYGVFDTGGAARYPGRWHNQGTLVVYASAHISLCVLERLVHLNEAPIPLPEFSISRIRLADDTPIEDAPWSEEPESRTYGDEFFWQQRGPLLRVPSAVTNRLEHNFVLNRWHPDFDKYITFEQVDRFVIDSRLLQPKTIKIPPAKTVRV
jgi:RES domain-containing protein